MKITKDTRINAVMFQQNDKDILLFSSDQNMLLSEYIKNCSLPFIMSGGQMPNPNRILDMDFKVEDSFIGDTGHTFTTLVSQTKDYVCSVVKLDLAKS